MLTGDAAPVTVAFSGGGDSLALLLMAHDWAAAQGRPLLAVTIDHRLRPEGADWARWCAARCDALGVEHRILTWDGEKPAAGVAAAARRARHALLAQAARGAGGAVILMAHTADDRAEAALMRDAGSTAPSPRAWSPSPAWPEGRGVFILRPWLEVRRERLREILRARGERWIDDPANHDPASLRAAVRRRLGESPIPPADPAPRCALDLDEVIEGPAGDLDLPVAFLDGDGGRSLLGAALLCASGRDRPARGGRLDALLARVRTRDRVGATLAGARIACDGARLRIVRDATDLRHRSGDEVELPPGRATVWDGRVECLTDLADVRVGLLAGRSGLAPREARAALRAAAPAVRLALPLAVLPDGSAACPTLAPHPRIEAIPLAKARLAGALGMIVDEAGLRRMAKAARTS